MRPSGLDALPGITDIISSDVLVVGIEVPSNGMVEMEFYTVDFEIVFHISFPFF